MKKTLILAAIALLAVSCRNRATQKANWEIDIEESEFGFSWQNSLAGFSIGLQDDDASLTSMGFNIWLPDEESEEETSLGFAGRCLGIGGSAPLGTSGFYYPDKIDRSAKVLMHSPDRAVMAIFYPKTDILGTQVSLDKQITMVAGSPFIQVIDTWDGDFEGLNVVAGVVRSDSQDISAEGKVLKITYRQSMTVVIVMPDADKAVALGDEGHAYLGQTAAPGHGMYYYIGVFPPNCENIDHLTDSILSL